MSRTMAEEKTSANPAKWNLASHVANLEASIIREILKISSQPGVISFAGGLPAPEMFPIEELKILQGCKFSLPTPYRPMLMIYQMISNQKI